MGYQKHLAEERQHQHNIVIELAVRTGEMKRCPVCDEATTSLLGDEAEETLALGTKLLAEGDEIVGCFDEKQFAAAVADTFNETSDSCSCGD